MSENYIYIFVREDLSYQQQIIQVAHSVHTMSFNLDSTDMPYYPHNTNAVLIGVKNEDELYKISQYLDENNVDSEMFYEMDKSAYTSISTYPVKGKERGLFKKFNLM